MSYGPLVGDQWSMVAVCLSGVSCRRSRVTSYYDTNTHTCEWEGIRSLLTAVRCGCNHIISIEASSSPMCLHWHVALTVISQDVRTPRWWTSRQSPRLRQIVLYADVVMKGEESRVQLRQSDLQIMREGKYISALIMLQVIFIAHIRRQNPWWTQTRQRIIGPSIKLDLSYK